MVSVKCKVTTSKCFRGSRAEHCSSRTSFSSDAKKKKKKLWDKYYYKKNCTYGWVDFRKALPLFSFISIKRTIISIEIISLSTWGQIVSDVWEEHKGHWGLFMVHWMEINGSLFCQLLLAVSPTICCLSQREGLLLLFLLWVYPKNRLRLNLCTRLMDSLC